MDDRSQRHAPLVLRSRHAGHPRPVTDRELDNLWNAMCAEGLAPVVFHDGGVRSARDLRALLHPDRAWCYLVQADDAPLALCWLDGFSGRAARIHFCVLRAGQRRAEEIGRMVVRFLLAATAQGPGTGHGTGCETGHEGHATPHSPRPCGADAPFRLDTLVGLTPAPYRHAIGFVQRLGFRRVAVIPAAATLVRPGGTRTCDAVLTLCTRNDLT